jgi:hypothetical protein
MTNYTKEQLNFIRSVNSRITPTRKMPACGEDLTIDGYISKYGGIESQVDGKVYTTKGGYLDHLKANNCHIKDY